LIAVYSALTGRAPRPTATKQLRFVEPGAGNLFQYNPVYSPASIDGSPENRMHAFTKFVAVLAAVGVLVVLVTPVPDELPCTARHGAPPLLSIPLNVISFLVQPILPKVGSAYAPAQMHSGKIFLALGCMLLC
jgi:hypothetical protein